MFKLIKVRKSFLCLHLPVIYTKLTVIRSRYVNSKLFNTLTLRYQLFCDGGTFSILLNTWVGTGYHTYVIDWLHVCKCNHYLTQKENEAQDLFESLHTSLINKFAFQPIQITICQLKIFCQAIQYIYSFNINISTKHPVYNMYISLLRD